MSRPLILVTGAAGFVGHPLCRALRARNYAVRATVRAMQGSEALADGDGTEIVETGTLSAQSDWTAALDGVETVIHLAARAHTFDTGPDALERYRAANVEVTATLAAAAIRSGVGRFVLLSSAKVNGEPTTGRVWTEDDAPQPEDAYGISKWETEQRLADIVRGSSMAFTILRPPLVYGPGVKGNFLRLLDAVARGWPLPLGAIDNRRSLVYVGNLVDATLHCIESPTAAGRTYLVSDGEDRSTPQLLRAIATALGMPSRVFPFPAALLRLGAACTGQLSAFARLTQSMQVDSSPIRHELGWHPSYSFDQGIAETAAWYRGRAT